MAQEKVSRFNDLELDDFRRKLQEAKVALLESERDVEAEGLIGDSDFDGFRRESMLNLAEDEIQEIRDIEGALLKIQKGTYGICEECRCEIPSARLEAQPYARYCGPCELKLEKRRIDELHRSTLRH